ncbi:MAG: spermidine synthase [Longimicrobiales bacterium]
MSALPFALTVFAGAFLLFQVQPLLGRYVLPWFGGSPSVWTTCVLFFQVILLGGYAYAHGMAAWATPRRQALAHGVLLLAAAATLPIVPSAAWHPLPEQSPAARVLLLLLVTVGLPAFVLSATGPLVQKWHAQLAPGRPAYRLYSLSNAGSLLALLSYPVLFEPVWTRPQQAWAWSGGFVLFALLAGWSAWEVARAPTSGGTATTGQMDAASPNEAAEQPACPRLDHVLLWVALTACGAALLLAVTNAVCYDLAAIPLFWVVPLAFYLLSFVICFDSPRRYRRTVYVTLFAVSVWAVCRIAGTGNAPLMRQLPVYLGMLLVGCIVCHGEAYRLRPHPRHLTGFYLAIALGGALGGAFVAVVAPVVFTGYAELYWAMAVTGVAVWLALRPDAREPGKERRRRWVWLAGAPVVVVYCVMIWQAALGAAGGGGRIAATRSFYGALAVRDFGRNDTRYRELRHGSIVHGLQILTPGRSRVATAYYGEDSGVGWAMSTLPDGQGRRVGVVGLGAGTVAAYGRPGDVYRFYELSPDVARLADQHFTFLRESEAAVEVVLGDARLSLESQEPQGYDLIVLDAFNGDAIPVHLLTREAFDEYRRHLRPGGLIAAHVSNRFVDLRPVVIGAAHHLGLTAVVAVDRNESDEWWIEPSTWVLMGGSGERPAGDEPIGRPGAWPLGAPPGLPPMPAERLWTDDRSSVFGILKW